MLILALLLVEYYTLSTKILPYNEIFLWFKVFLLALPLCFIAVFYSWRVMCRISFLYNQKHTVYHQLLPDFPDRLLREDDSNDDNDDF